MEAEDFPGSGLPFATSINHKECKQFELKTQWRVWQKFGLLCTCHVASPPAAVPWMHFT